MSQRQRYDLARQAFSALTRPPRPELTDRIRKSISARPAPGGRRVGRRLGRALLAVLIAAALVIGVASAVLEGPAAVHAASSASRDLNARVTRLLTPPSATPTPAPALTATPTPTATPTSTPSATPTPTPTAEPTPPPTTPPLATLPGYSCAAQSGGGGQASMTTARVGAQNGYDRFVVQFAGPVPQYEVTLQQSASFAAGGGPVTLQGTAGLRVVLHDATGAGAYGGPSDLRPGFSQIQEARLLSDSQGVVEWGVGLAYAACFRAWTLGGPSRLVIDVAR